MPPSPSALTRLPLTDRETSRRDSSRTRPDLPDLIDPLDPLDPINLIDLIDPINLAPLTAG
jgi:hypothetical protein